MSERPHDAIGRALTGDVLEIGPGHRPFPTAAGARVVFADKKVEGGRDAVWPELAGAPRGPEAQFQLDLDRQGLQPIASGSFDAVIASHVIEHAANPVRVLLEMDRVLRADGRLVLVVPERSRTFDAPRPATPAAHVLDEYERGVSSVDDQHVREFCEAIWAQPPIHPEPVREWHDPARLDAQRLELHRRRSIHAHCWTAEEFVALLAVLVARGLARWRLEWQYLPEDLAGSIEFGLALSRTPEPGAQACAGLVRDWARGLAGVPGREAQRLVGLERAIARDLAGAAGASVAALTERLAAVAAERDALRSELRAILGSRSFRAARALAALRRRLRGFASRD